MAVLVTGAGGFVGRAVLDRLLQTGADVVALDSQRGDLNDAPRLRTFVGDLADPALRKLALVGIDAVIHLAAVPGGAAEADPALSRRVNLEATLDLLNEVAARSTGCRFVFASTIAVLGDPLPASGVDDDTPLRPRLIYGAHKAMIETMVATLSRRGALDGISVRLPGIVARPQGPSGMKSAFMSNVFHALQAGQPFTVPVSREATLWLMSVDRVARNLVRALSIDSTDLPQSRALTLPALRVGMAELAAEIAEQVDHDPGLIAYASDSRLEAAFGAHPVLATPAGDRVGFSHDGSVDELVRSALSTLS